MIHPNLRKSVTAQMKTCLLRHMNVDQTLERVAELNGIDKGLAAALVPKDATPESRTVLGLFIAAEVTTQLEAGRTDEQALDAALARFDIQAPPATRLSFLKMCSAERERLSKLRPGEYDNGVGGTMQIVDSKGNPVVVGKKS